MSGTLQYTKHDSTLERAGAADGLSTPGRSRGLVVALAAATLALVLAACGGSDTGTESASADSTSSSSEPATDAAESDGSAAAAPAVDLAPVSDCIAAADIVVAPTTFSESFMAEQSLAGVLDVGALGVEFGGGQLFFYETEELADAKYESLTSGGTDAAVRQDGTAVLEYRSAVQEEAADLIMGCVG